MLKKVLIGLAAIVVLFLGVVATRPAEFRIERSASIGAPADIAFELVNDFHAWGAWSPWEKLDPAMQKTYEGPAAGVGAIYAWAGNDQVGAGRMTITDSKPSESIAIKLEFLKPWQATNETTFAFRGEGDKTAVTWAMTGKNDFMGKLFSLFMNMDEMVGKDFDSGLANLNAQGQAANARRQAELAQAAQAVPAPDAAAATK